MDFQGLKTFLEHKTAQYNHPAFIEDDPVTIPRSFKQKQDIEIMGLLAAIMAWGQRKTIINKCLELVDLMEGQPYDFIMHHKEKDLERFEDFRHRTFQPTDILYFIRFFRDYYHRYESLETAFIEGMQQSDETVEQGLIHFHQLFCSLSGIPKRTRKHIATPEKGSSCKRLNMFLRWMVRQDEQGVDFGLWQELRPHQLICPLDVHVARVARALNLISRKQADWKAALELTEALKTMDPKDPVKYDFALFGLGIVENFQHQEINRSKVDE